MVGSRFMNALVMLLWRVNWTAAATTTTLQYLHSTCTVTANSACGFPDYRRTDRGALLFRPVSCKGLLELMICSSWVFPRRGDNDVKIIILNARGWLADPLLWLSKLLQLLVSNTLCREMPTNLVQVDNNNNIGWVRRRRSQSSVANKFFAAALAIISVNVCLGNGVNWN